MTLSDQYGSYALVIDRDEKIEYGRLGGSVWVVFIAQLRQWKAGNLRSGGGGAVFTPRARYQAYTVGIAWLCRMCGGRC